MGTTVFDYGMFEDIEVSEETQGDSSSKRNRVIGVAATLGMPVAFTRRERRSEGTNVTTPTAPKI